MSKGNNLSDAQEKPNKTNKNKSRGHRTQSTISMDQKAWNRNRALRVQSMLEFLVLKVTNVGHTMQE